MRKLLILIEFRSFAERARFDLAEELPLRQFSKLVVSATHPPLRGFISEIGGKNTLFFDMTMASTKKNFDVDFDIGFWLFPIFLNELKNQ